jgi:hypothetical protein
MDPNPPAIRQDFSTVMLAPTAVGCCPSAADAVSLIFGTQSDPLAGLMPDAQTGASSIYEFFGAGGVPSK